MAKSENALTREASMHAFVVSYLGHLKTPEK